MAPEPAPPTPSDIEAAVRAAIDDLPAAGDVAGSPDRQWLGLGLRLGLERPDRARQLLALLTEEAAVAPQESAEAEAVPIRSRLLARSAGLTESLEAEAGPDAVFGWVSRLHAGEILAMGNAVQRQLDEGAPANVARGFGLAWQDGAKIPMQQLNGMLAEFAELEVVAASVLAGHDLVTGPTPRGSGESRGLLGSLLGPLMRTPAPGSREADQVLQRQGRPAQLGLVALWNAWSAVRFRDQLRPETFARLVQPWVSVVGPLPDLGAQRPNGRGSPGSL